MSDDFKDQPFISQAYKMSRPDLVQKLVQVATHHKFTAAADLDLKVIWGSLGITRLEVIVHDTTVEIFLNDYNPPASPTGKNYVSTPWEEAETDLGTAIQSYFQSRPISSLTFANQHKERLNNAKVEIHPPIPPRTLAETVRILRDAARSAGFVAEIDLDGRAVRGHLNNTLLEIHLTDQEITLMLREGPSVFAYPTGATLVRTNYQDAEADVKKSISEYLQIKSSIHPSRPQVSGGFILGPE
jgi:hypothetical protein